MIITNKPTILVLGSDHFSNQNHGDLFMTQTDDILSDTRQKEMGKVIACLKRFESTKVALEVTPKYEDKINKDYVSYQNGQFSLSANEIHQIGFRLANKCNLDKVYAVDWNESTEDVPNLSEIAESNESEIWNEIENNGQEMTTQSEQFYNQHTIKEYLLWLNQEKNITCDHKVYMKIALVESEGNPVGAMWTAKYWYYRNLLIYKNLVSLISSENERIFVLYGAGHLHLLLQFLHESGLFHVEVASDYLGQ